MKMPFILLSLRTLYYLAITGLILSGTVQAQVETKSNSFKKASQKIELGYKRNNQDTLTQGYYELGDLYFRQGNLVQSEGQLKRAKAIAQLRGDGQGIARTCRLLATVQEELKKYPDAISNYDLARQSNIALKNLSAATLNENDIARLRDLAAGVLQEKNIAANIAIGKSTNDTAEIVNGYARLGTYSESRLGTNAVSTAAYKEAYEYSKQDPMQARKFNQLVTDAYVRNKDYAAAIETKKKIVSAELADRSPEIKASESIALADLYSQQNDDSNAVTLLKQSRQIAKDHGYSIEAIRATQKLDSIYTKLGNTSKRLELFLDLTTSLPSIMAKDSSLVEGKFVLETEARLKLLENEKVYKDDSIKRKNILNVVLSLSLAAMLVSLTIILITLRKLKRQNKKIALQSLRREMNPHFIFNSLNSVNQFIANNNELAANQFLSKFSTLMRTVVEDSKTDFIPLSHEIAFLKNYLELEKSRFPAKFDFRINISDDLSVENDLFVPGMLLQPHLENAIWHGLRYRDDFGILVLNMLRKENFIEVVIDDNGIGISASKRLKTDNQKVSSGRGSNSVLERIRLVNELYGYNIVCRIVDKPVANPGVTVTLLLPIVKHLPV